MKNRLRLRAPAAAMCLVVLVAPGLVAPAAAEGALPIVTAVPTSGVTDGQAVAINIRNTAGATALAAAVQLCRSGVSYLPSEVGGGSPTAPDFQIAGPNCPEVAISSSSDLNTNDNARGNFADPEGETFLYRVGAGITTWKDRNGTSRTLTCDSDHPCSLVVEVAYTDGGAPRWRPFVFEVTYAKDDPFGGCGGPAKGAIETGGSDRMIDAWVAWTRQECTRPGRSGAASRATFVGEGNAVTCFSSGDLDLAYTAGGYDPAMGLLPPSDSSQQCRGNRPAVAVPIAVNAAVLGVAGGQKLVGHNVPFRSVKLKVDEVATLLSGGSSPAMNPYLAAIRERNPEFVGGFFSSGGGFAGNPVGAYAGPEATSWYATRWLKTLAPDAWRVPENATFGDEQGLPRGIDTSLALAKPSFAKALSLLTGRPVMRKGVLGVPFEGTGVFALTDLATAKAIALTPVQLANARGDFVAPTPESLLAAVAVMKPDDQGILISDPSATADPAKVQPYPLTMVEYALAPAEALVDEKCGPRTDSQALLKGWLAHLVGDGQASLPPGFVPLPPDLRTAAGAAIDKVGATPTTKTCPDTEGPATPTDPGTGVPSAVTGPAGTGWTPIPSSASTRRPRSTAWPRRFSARGGSSRTGPRPACTSGRRRQRSAPTTPASCASACSRREG